MGELRRLQPREASVQTSVIDLAHLRRWRVAHFRPARTGSGEWRTPVAADGKGYPDLTLTRDRVVFAEMKKQREKPRADQVEWLDALAQAGGEVYVWTLDDLVEIDQILRRRWRFVPVGVIDSSLRDTRLDGPRLIDDDGRVSMRPRSAWIPGHGRRDA